MKNLYLVYTLIYNTKYFVGLYNTKKQAKKMAKENNGFVETYTE